MRGGIKPGEYGGTENRNELGEAGACDECEDVFIGFSLKFLFEFFDHGVLILVRRLGIVLEIRLLLVCVQELIFRIQINP